MTTTPLPGCVLIVEDDAQVANSMRRILARDDLKVLVALTAPEALTLLSAEDIDVVVSDIVMPQMSGVDLVREIRRRDLDLPVIFVTGLPSFDTAVRAIELHAFRYLEKPLDADLLVEVVDEALRIRSLVTTTVIGNDGTWRDRLGLQTSFRRAVEGLHAVFQPIVDPAARTIVGYEALMRTREPTLPHPAAVLDAAEKLGSLHTLGQAMRATTAAALAYAPRRMQLFINVHSADLVDESLYSSDAPLAAHAKDIVLELTERASLEGVADVQARIRRLREVGYRVAIDDMGAGYAGLSYFATVRPDVVKLDMSLVRGIERDHVRSRVVKSLVDVAHDLGMTIVGEGVETADERDALVELGCNYLQGYLFARPAVGFPAVRWP